MQQQLTDGLVLRSLSEGHLSDRERLPDLYAAINTEGESERVKDGMRHWTRSLMDGHPTVTPDDIFVVVDTAQDDLLVSATLLIPQTWRYGDILLPAGRPELVATHWDYRGRGLVRVLFDAVHERSAALGHLVQGITGIPHFYRKLGYTMAVDLDDHAVYHLSALPTPPADYIPNLVLRAATPEDIPDILDWNARFARERLVSDAFTAADLHYEITGRERGYYPHTEYLMMAATDGSTIGYLVVLDSLREPYYLRCVSYVVGPNASYLAAFDASMHALKVWATARYEHCPEMVYFYPGLHETIDQLIDHSPGGLVSPRKYAWYMRVPDVVKFLKTITPVLERRIEGSGAHRCTGELRIGFYTLGGVRIRFDGGRISDITLISGKDDYDAEFPWELFWNLVLGYRTVDEMGRVLPDVYAKAKAAVLLSILFPKQSSWLRGLA